MAAAATLSLPSRSPSHAPPSSRPPWRPPCPRSVVSLWAGVYHTWLEPAFGMPDIVVSDLPLNITAFALSLLLVFRTDR